MKFAKGKYMLPIRILFVEEDPEMSSIYRENFLKPEFEASFVENGKNALKLLRNAKEKFKVMVCDKSTHEMEGITTLKLIRQEFPNLVMIIIMGYEDEGPDTEDNVSEINKFLKKPTKMASLKEVVRVCVERLNSYQE
jgi:two-component system, NtrC family, response regulator HupR/HoxA